MAEEKMRTFEFEGKRRGVRLDGATWAAVDWLAEHRGMKWPELAREWAMLALHGEDKDENFTRIIRSSAMAELMNETVLAERADNLSGLQPAGFRQATMCDDAGFEEAISVGILEGVADLVSVKIHAGIDEHGHIAYYVKNQLQECPHMIISTPFTPAEWLDRVEA